MKKFGLVLLSILIVLTLAACACEHEYDNSCDTACNLCGEERSTAHEWQAADCNTPKTCTVCGEEEGEALGHEWVTPDADLCEVQSTCSRCGATDGENVEHEWENATCTLPKTCTVCGATEGKANEHDYAEEFTATADGHFKHCICHPEINEVLPHKNENGDTLCDVCLYDFNQDYTVTLDKAYEGVEITLTSGDGENFSALTDKDGVAVLNLPKGEYTLSVKHYNAAHIWTDKDSTVTLTEESPAYEASFEVTTERVEYDILILAPDGSICTSGLVFVYAADGDVDGVLAINSIGHAVTYTHNGDYILSIHAGDYYKRVEFKKDGATSITVKLEECTAPMTADNPMIIYDICPLPFEESFVSSLPFDNSYDFEAGESLYFILPYAGGKTITLGTDRLTLEYGGEVRTPNGNGEYIIDAEPDESIVIKLTATEACTEDVKVN